MPCRDGGPTEADLVRERLDEVTRLLCSTLKLIEKEDTLLRLEVRDLPGLATWWEQHKKEDRIREEREERYLLQERKRLKKEMRDNAQHLANIESKHASLLRQRANESQERERVLNLKPTAKKKIKKRV